MIPILVVVLIVVLANLLVTSYRGLHQNPTYSESALKNCPGPHTWTYNHVEQLQCTECNFIAGQE
jgi:hypothetical protein